MKYGLFLGCNMPALRPDIERAIRLTMPRLGVELIDLEGYVCCPAFGTFPSLDEDAYLACSAWNMSIAEAKGLDLMVECGSCYSSLKNGKHQLEAHPERRERVNELLADTGKKYSGTADVRHISDVMFTEVGVDAIRSEIEHTLAGMHVVIQYPCHTLFPSEVVGFEESSTRPHALASLVEALGAEVDHYSLEYQCRGGAGGFHGGSPAEANAFTRSKFDAIKAETNADLIVVSCITCLMHLDNVQKELGDDYALPILDYNQLLALCMGYPASEVASISTVSRDEIVQRVC